MASMHTKVSMTNEKTGEQLVFVDESGVTTEMTRRYGRALYGYRVDEVAPAGRRRTLTVLGAVAFPIGWLACP